MNKTKSNDELSPLFERLAQPKKNHASAQRVPIPHYEFSCGRSSPIRECRAPKKANCSARLTELAKHKNRSGDKNHQTFEFSCGRTSPIWKVSQVQFHSLVYDKSLHFREQNTVSHQLELTFWQCRSSMHLDLFLIDQ